VPGCHSGVCGAAASRRQCMAGRQRDDLSTPGCVKRTSTDHPPPESDSQSESYRAPLAPGRSHGHSATAAGLGSTCRRRSRLGLHSEVQRKNERDGCRGRSQMYHKRRRTEFKRLQRGFRIRCPLTERLQLLSSSGGRQATPAGAAGVPNCQTAENGSSEERKPPGTAATASTTVFGLRQVPLAALK
jgi:hypothetical protein